MSARRGVSRVHRNTYDLDSEQACVHAPLGGDGTFDSSNLVRKALIDTVEQIQVSTAGLMRYSQGAISRAACKAITTLLETKNRFDHFTGTNDLAVSDIARLGGFSERHWQRMKPRLQELGIMSYRHRSIRTGLPKNAGVDENLQISDIHWFEPERLVPWIKEVFDACLTKLKAEQAQHDHRGGRVRRPRPLIKLARAKCRIPARLNPIGWARCIAASARPAPTYAEMEARSLAFATQLALNAPPG